MLGCQIPSHHHFLAINIPNSEVEQLHKFEQGYRLSRMLAALADTMGALVIGVYASSPWTWGVGVSQVEHHIPPWQVHLRALEEGVRDSGFKPLNGPEIQDSNFKQARIRDSNFIWAIPVYILSRPVTKLGFKFQTGYSGFTFYKGWDSRFKFESQKNGWDSRLTFGLQGPYSSSSVPLKSKKLIFDVSKAIIRRQI